MLPLKPTIYIYIIYVYVYFSSLQMPHVQDYLIPLTELKPMLDVGDDALGAVYSLHDSICPYFVL